MEEYTKANTAYIEHQVSLIFPELYRQGCRIVILGISGSHGAGKTEISLALYNMLHRCVDKSRIETHFPFAPVRSSKFGLSVIKLVGEMGVDNLVFSDLENALELVELPQGIIDEVLSLPRQYLTNPQNIRAILFGLATIKGIFRQLSHIDSNLLNILILDRSMNDLYAIDYLQHGANPRVVDLMLNMYADLLSTRGYDLIYTAQRINVSRKLNPPSIIHLDIPLRVHPITASERESHRGTLSPLDPSTKGRYRTYYNLGNIFGPTTIDTTRLDSFQSSFTVMQTVLIQLRQVYPHLILLHPDM